MVFSAKSVITTQTFKLIAKIKNSLLDKDIMQGLFNHKWALVRTASGLIRSSMSNTLNYADEILVSYTWMATRLYKDFGPDGRKPKITKLLKNQAMFFLEGFVHFIRSYPKLVVSTIGLNIILICISIAIVIFCFLFLGLSWVNIFWIIFFWTSITVWVDKVLVHYSHTLLILDKFYKNLHKMESMNLSFEALVSTIGSIPILANIAKKTGIKEFNNMNFEETCPSNLLEVNAVEEMLSDEARRVAEIFNVNSDEIPEDDAAAEEDMTDAGYEEDVEAEEPVEGIPPEDVPIEELNEEVSEEDTKAEEISDDGVFQPIVEGEEAEDENFDFDGLPKIKGRFVGKFKE